MALRSVYTIDVDDSQFQRFKDTFDRYTEVLNKTPAVWQQAGQQTADLSKQFDRMTALLMAQNEALHIASGEHTKATRETEKQAGLWQRIARATGSVASHVAHATRSLLRWGSIAGIGGGLLGFGALFGLDRIAGLAGGGRRSALGLGTTFGGMRAFESTYGRLVEPRSFLGGVNEALHNIGRRYTLYNAGLSEADLRGKNTTEVGVELLSRLKSLADRTPDAMLAQIWQARGLGQFMTLEEFQRLKATPRSELREYQQEFRQALRQQQVSGKILKAWQDLDAQLKRSKFYIESTFINALAPLVTSGTLEKLSKGFAGVVAAFLKSDAVKHWIEELDTGLGKLANYISTPQFQKDVEEFAKKISTVTVGIIHFGEAVARVGDKLWGWLGGKPDAPQQFGGRTFGPGSGAAPAFAPWMLGAPGWSQAARQSFPGAWGWWSPFFQGFREPAFRARGSGVPAPLSPGAPGSPPGATPDRHGFWWHAAPWHWHFERGGAAPGGTPPAAPPSAAGGPSAPASFSALERWAGLPGGVLEAVWTAESGRGRFMRSPAGALGHFQFMPGTWAQYGRGSPFDLRASSVAAARYLHHLLAEFGGNIAEALAAYNWGEGNLRRDIRMHGANWWRHLPRETERYLRSILPHVHPLAPATPGAPATPAMPANPARPWRHRNPTPVIEVRNVTGGSAVIAASQLAV